MLMEVFQKRLPGTLDMDLQELAGRGDVSIDDISVPKAGADQMAKKIGWEGVFPAVTTQFKSNFELDLDATAKVLDGLIRDGVSGLIVCGMRPQRIFAAWPRPPTCR